MANLNTTPGDGGLRVGVDVYGAFGSSVGGTETSNAFYDPLGEAGEAGTVFQSFLVLRGDSFDGTISLTSSNLGNSEFISSSATVAESDFTVAGLDFELNQALSELLGEEQRTGSSLLQTYTITNPGTEAVEFELVRYVDGDLSFDGSIQDSGGRLFAGGQEILFETDSGENPLFATTFVGITASGGSTELPGRFEVDSFSGLRNRILGGIPLDDTVAGDGDDEDEFIDAFPYDVTIALRNSFVLEPGESTTYTTTTIFGSGSPEDVDTTVPDNVGNTIPTAKDLSVLIGTRIENDFIGGIDLNDFFRFELIDNSDFDLTLSGLGIDANVALLDDRGNTVDSFAAGESIDASISQNLDAGTYYIRVFRLGADTTPYNLEVSATPVPPPFQIRSITPDEGSNAGQSTITIFGDRFTTEADVSLIDNAGNERQATSVTWLDSETLSATFDLADSAVDSYDVRVIDTPGTATIEDAFDVSTGDVGELEVFVSSPSRIRSFGSSVVTVTYRNTGDTDITAPLLELTAEGANFRDFGAAEFTEDSIQFLGINNEGLAGVLPAGASGSFTIEFEPTAGIGEQINFSVDTVNPDDTVNWEEFREELRPASLTVEAWNPIYDNFVASVGNTAGDYQQILVDNANYLSRIGERVADADRLVGFELQQASDYQTISQRYSLGSFGRGRPFIGDIRVFTDEDGNVTIENSDTRRFFERQADGTFRSQTSSAQLIQDGNTYRLREQDGTITAFRADGRLDFIEDTNDNRFTANYTNNQLTSLVSSDNESLTFTYNNQGRIATTTNQVGQTNTYTYNSTGELLLSITDATGTTSYSYNDDFAITSITDANGIQALFEYDDRGRLIQESFNDGTETLTYTFDENGSFTVTDSTGATTEHLLNDRGQLTQLRDAFGRTQQFRYDETGNLTRLITPDNNVTVFTYDERDNLINHVNPLGEQLEFTYEPTFNQLTSVTDARDNTIDYSYDDRGNLTSITYADGSSETFSYDNRGNVTQSVNRRGQTINYAYNSLDLLLRQDNPDGSFLEYTYDDRGNITSATDNQGITTMAYDNANRLTKITYPTGRFLEYTYDANGSRNKVVDQEGNAVNYSYDAAGRLAGLTDEDGNSIISYTYDTVGRLTREDNGNGTYTTYGYDADGQLLNIVNYAVDDSINSRYDYTYDNLGHRTKVSTLDGEWNYSYDAIGQLTDAVFDSANPEIADQNLTYIYDAAGNRIRTIENGVIADYDTNDLNQYTTVGEITYEYDLDGNLISKIEGSDTWTYTYNEQNQLVSVIEPNGTQTNYEYDAFGNRIATIYDGQRTEYLIDPFGFGDVFGEYDASGNLIAQYTYGLNLVSRTDDNDVSAYYDSNAIGSIVGLTGTTGNYLNRYLYQPFGEEIFETEAIRNPFEFIGLFGVMEEENGLDFMRARYYESDTGRFITTDPLGVQGGVNLYRYAEGNPISYADPTGELAWFVAPILGGVIGGGIELATQLYQNGGRWDCVDVGDVLVAGGLGALFSSLGPSGVVFGRGGSTAAKFGYKAGVLNQGNFRIGWSYNQGRNWFSIHGGKPYTNGHWHRDLIPGPQGTGVAGFGVGGGVAGGATGAVSGGNDCEPEEPPSPESPIDPDRDLDDSSTDIVNSFDPNDIIGPAGFGEQGWIASPQLLPYTIRFENEAERATAPAVLVTINHTLDSDLDLDSFELGDFGFGDLVVDVPDGFQNYSERLDLRDDIGSFVDFEATLNRETATVTWTLTTIDPDTGELATGVDDGFLPPNVENGEGEGFVNYTIRPQDDLATGTEINAVADIIFDFNEPIVTPEVLNTIDVTDPTSMVEALPETVGEEFTVSWTGTDEGSGIAFYDIFVSINGGEFTLWQDDIIETSAVYEGEVGETYSFYSVAIDNVGYIEDIPTQGDTSTTVVAESDNNPPIAEDDAFSTVENTAITIPALDLLTNDTDPDGDTLTIESVANAINGTVELDDTNITFTPDADFEGDASFIYTISDGLGGEDSANVSITVTPDTSEPNVIEGSPGRDNLSGTDENDLITGGQGRDVISTGDGQDILFYSSIVDAGDIITDFEVGADIFDFSQLLESFSYEGSDPIADGYIQVVGRGSSSIINVDVDGLEGSGRARQFVLVENVTSEDLSNPDNFDF